MQDVYDYQGNAVDVFIINPLYDRTVKGIAHRGLSSIAPENTLPAYILAKKSGFYYVETDVALTSDGVPVCLHDTTIDRTSDGSGAISSMTWEQVQQYDFGGWKSEEFIGTKIPSFEQFIDLCKKLMLHPYIEIKNTESFTQAQIEGLVDIVHAHGMAGKVTWISFSYTYLNYVKSYDPTARLGLVAGELTSALINSAKALRTETNHVFIDTSDTTSSAVIMCKNDNLPMEVWVTDSEETILEYDPYITGVTSNSLIAGKVLYDNAMEL